MSLCTVADLEKFGQVDFTNNTDPAVLLYIAAAEAAVTNFCGRAFTWQVARVDTLDGPGQPHLYLPLYPVDAVTSVVEDGDTLTAGTDYLVYGSVGRITRMFDDTREWAWTRKRQSVVVTYDGGYDEGGVTGPDVPDDLRWVAANVALRLYKAEAAWASSPAGAVGPATSVALDGVGSVSYAGAAAGGQQAGGSQAQAGSSPNLTAAEKAALAPYRRLHFGGSARPQDVW